MKNEAFEKYWKGAVNKPPYTPKAMAEHAWNAALAQNAEGTVPEKCAQQLLQGYAKGLKGEELRDFARKPILDGAS